MASRWRTWDSDFFIDAHSSKMPEETELIPAVGQGRGKPLKDIASLTLPKAALGITKEKNTAQAPATGRGRASVMKARALTDSPPIRRPGEKTTTTRITVVDVKFFFLTFDYSLLIFVIIRKCLFLNSNCSLKSLKLSGTLNEVLKIPKSLRNTGI